MRAHACPKRFLTRPKHQKNPRFWATLFCRIQQTVLKSGVCKSESAFHTVPQLWVCFFTPMSRRETNFSGISTVQMIGCNKCKHVILKKITWQNPLININEINLTPTSSLNYPWFVDDFPAKGGRHLSHQANFHCLQQGWKATKGKMHQTTQQWIPETPWRKKTSSSFNLEFFVQLTFEEDLLRSKKNWGIWDG